MAALRYQDIQDPSVRKALKKALTGYSPGRLDHWEVVEIIRSTFDFGAITKKEQQDLNAIWKKSRSLTPRSRRLLFSLLHETSMTSGSKPRSFLLPEKASKKICDLLKRNGKGAFLLDRDQVGLGLLMRLHKPSLIDQGPSSLCGPSALLFNLARDKPLEYANFAVDLYEKGKAKIGKLTIEPSDDCLNYVPPHGKIHPADWMTAASIRDSENAFFDYQSVDDTFSGITMPGALAEWLKKAGYKDVQNNTNVFFDKTSKTIDKTNDLYDKHYRVCLFINANMMYQSDQSDGSATPNHWVVLRSRISRAGKNVSMKVFSWGDGDRKIPANASKPLSESDFLNNFYGYVAAKPF